jgi:hypothetical protein
MKNWPLVSAGFFLGFALVPENGSYIYPSEVPEFLQNTLCYNPEDHTSNNNIIYIKMSLSVEFERVLNLLVIIPKLLYIQSNYLFIYVPNSTARFEYRVSTSIKQQK